jgi:hypothetical protein
MFYDMMGVVLGRGGVALRDRHSVGSLGDERDQREFRQISLLLRRVSAIWPDLFAALEEETAVLSATLTAVNEARQAVGMAVDDFPVEPDPLKRYQSVNRGLEQAVIALHARHEEQWAADALHRLRLGLAEAADIQGRLVDTALDV